MTTFDTSALQWSSFRTSGDVPPWRASHTAVMVPLGDGGADEGGGVAVNPDTHAMYVYGGVSGAATPLPEAMGDVFADMHRYWPSQRRWEAVHCNGDLPPGRFGHTMVLYDPATYGCVGSRIGGDGAILSLSPRCDQASSAAALASPSVKLIIFGGQDTPISTPGPTLSDVHVSCAARSCHAPSVYHTPRPAHAVLRRGHGDLGAPHRCGNAALGRRVPLRRLRGAPHVCHRWPGAQRRVAGAVRAGSADADVVRAPASREWGEGGGVGGCSAATARPRACVRCAGHSRTCSRLGCCHLRAGVLPTPRR